MTVRVQESLILVVSGLAYAYADKYPVTFPGALYTRPQKEIESESSLEIKAAEVIDARAVYSIGDVC